MRERDRNMSILQELEPQKVFHYFEELSKIPRGTFDVKRVSDYCADFAKERGLEYIQDDALNVIIKKPGTAGYENSEPVIIQGHLDMVCQKTENSTHDFKTDPIEIYVDGNYVKAKDTTLGADDGIAVAYALAILDSDDIPHPPLEIIFTIDEEIGMGGAKAIDLSGIKGTMFINIDSDEEGTLLAGCAGGVNYKIDLPIKREEKTGTVAEIKISGLAGGHSGAEIHKQRGNANKLMGRLLLMLSSKLEYNLIKVNGGDKENVIPSFNTAKVMIASDKVALFKSIITETEHTWKFEFGTDESDVQVTAGFEDNQSEYVLTTECTKKAVFMITATPDGVQGYNRELAGLVETSLNMGVLETKEDLVSARFMVRSSVESKKEEMKQMLTLWAEQLGASAEMTADFPAWMYKPDSKLRPIMLDTYKEVFGTEPILTTLHAGLECGILSGQKPDLDCVSFGPFMLDIHSVKERLDIASTKRMWDYLLVVLKNCK